MGNELHYARCAVLGISRPQALRLRIDTRRLTIGPEEAVAVIKKVPHVTNTGLTTLAKTQFIVVAYRGCPTLEMERQIIRALWPYCKLTD